MPQIILERDLEVIKHTVLRDLSFLQTSEFNMYRNIQLYHEINALQGIDRCNRRNGEANRTFVCLVCPPFV